MWKYNCSPSPSELFHYASPYYDPVKAHEYYMKNRELKGRTSTAGLNEKGREAAQYVKSQLNDERKSKAEELKKQSESESGKHKAQMQQEIATLRAKLLGMSKEERARNKSSVLKEIRRLRLENQEERRRLTARLKSSTASLKEEYDSKYESEIANLQSDSSFKQVKKSKKKSGGNSK